MNGRATGAVARLRSIAQRHGGWEAPAGKARVDALDELCAEAGGQMDLAIEAAGVMIGVHPPVDVMHNHYVSAAGLLLELAGVDEDAPKVQAWIAVGG